MDTRPVEHTTTDRRLGRLPSGSPVHATTSGLFETRPDVAVGDDVTAGEELGTLYCPSSFEHLATVTAETDGVVYSLTREGIVVAGERLAGVAPRR